MLGPDGLSQFDAQRRRDAADKAVLFAFDLLERDGKAAGVREAIEARGATLRFLPKYSPDLNPIEMPFSKFKAYLRKAGERTIPRLRGRISSFARNLSAREAPIISGMRAMCEIDRNLL